MADPQNQLSQFANDTGKALTVQATLGGVIGIALSHCYPFTTTEISTIASFLSLVIVWIGRRIINRADADEAAKEGTRAMVLLRDKLEQEVLAMDENDPRRKRRIDEVEVLSEAILLKTVDKDFTLVLKQQAIPPALPPSPENSSDESENAR